MKSLLIILTMFLNLTGCRSSGLSVVGDQKRPETAKPEGQWTLINIKIIKEKQSVEKYNETVKPKVPREWSPPVYIDANGVLKPHAASKYLSRPMKDLIFNGDSIFWMNYPLQMGPTDSYTIESDLLKVKNDNSLKSIMLNATRDTLRISYLDQFGLFLEETYHKTKFDDRIVNILKRYKLNLPELAGTWKLIREDSDEYGQEYQLNFPYTVADKLVLTKEELQSTLYTDRSCQMLTDGKERKYFINYRESELILTPDKWYDPDELQNKGRYVDKFLRFTKVK
ncbi:MAG: hypothetical protein ACJ77K_14825 [Bacteroidia bacterium]|jgi:hypothetical protein